MRNWIQMAVLAGTLASAGPAAAQYTFTQPGQAPQPVQQLQVWNNVARVNLGVSFFNSGYYNCNYWGGYYPTYTCGSGSFVSYIPFTPLGYRYFGFPLPFADEVMTVSAAAMSTATATFFNSVLLSNSATGSTRSSVPAGPPERWRRSGGSQSRELADVGRPGQGCTM
jgi:hypothetical protein